MMPDRLDELDERLRRERTLALLSESHQKRAEQLQEPRPDPALMARADSRRLDWIERYDVELRPSPRLIGGWVVVMARRDYFGATPREAIDEAMEDNP